MSLPSFCLGSHVTLVFPSRDVSVPPDDVSVLLDVSWGDQVPSRSSQRPRVTSNVETEHEMLGQESWAPAGAVPLRTCSGPVRPPSRHLQKETREPGDLQHPRAQGWRGHVPLPRRHLSPPPRIVPEPELRAAGH